MLSPGRLLESSATSRGGLPNSIPGVSCVKPMGAMYAFPKLDPEVHEIHDDEKLMLDILREVAILMVGGSGFNPPTQDHFRIVTPPGAISRRPSSAWATSWPVTSSREWRWGGGGIRGFRIPA